MPNMIFTIIDYPIALVVAAIVVHLLSKELGERATRNYRGMYDPEGNYGRAYGRAVKQSVLLATGIAGAIKLPAILGGIAKIVAASAGTP